MHGSATDPLVYPHPTTPQPGELTEVAPGIQWLRLALPFQLNHVNIYLIAHEGGWAVIDTGIGDDKTKATWDNVLSGPLKGTKITKLIITHSHPDHLGLANWLVDRAKCQLVMSQTEYFNGMYFNSRRSEEQIADQADFYRRHGIGEEGANALLGRGSNYLTRTTGLPPSYFRVKDGDTHRIGNRDFEVFTGGGHSLEQVMLLSRADKLFLSADQVLSKISPNVSVWSMEPESNALGQYIASLQRLKRDLPDDVLVLPGHGVPFFGVKIRIQQLLDHHVERCGMIAAATRDKPLTASEMVPVIFHRPLDAHQAGFATGEVIAHINYMQSRGELDKLTDSNGVMRFKAT